MFMVIESSLFPKQTFLNNQEWMGKNLFLLTNMRGVFTPDEHKFWLDKLAAVRPITGKPVKNAFREADDMKKLTDLFYTYGNVGSKCLKHNTAAPRTESEREAERDEKANPSKKAKIPLTNTDGTSVDSIVHDILPESGHSNWEEGKILNIRL